MFEYFFSLNTVHIINDIVIYICLCFGWFMFGFLTKHLQKNMSYEKVSKKFDEIMNLNEIFMKLNENLVKENENLKSLILREAQSLEEPPVKIFDQVFENMVFGKYKQ